MRHGERFGRRFPVRGSTILPVITACLLANAMAQPPEPPPGRPLPTHGDPLRRALDVNGDHELDADEISKAAEALATLDADEDGRITRDELFPRPPAGVAGRGPGNRDSEGRPGPRGEFGGPPREGGSGAPPPPPQEGDGFRPPPGPDPERFVERAMSFDADGDGTLDRAELDTFAAEAMGRMRPRDPERFRRDPQRADRGDGDGGAERRERPRRPDGHAGPDRPRRPCGEDDPPAESAAGERDDG
ncbi:MAG: hypothetical protein ACKO1M_03485 [Planctomycetota bacterium]